VAIHDDRTRGVEFPRGATPELAQWQVEGSGEMPRFILVVGEDVDELGAVGDEVLDPCSCDRSWHRHSFFWPVS
jgi:hypothetical protein